jgi:catechol 2,3-dioxygenase-like lactoylglutathione lyase family enzyme
MEEEAGGSITSVPLRTPLVGRLPLPENVPIMKTTQLNHVAIHVADVERSCDFYRNILQLGPLPRPDFDFPGAWFLLGADQELHIIGDRTADVVGDHRGNHYALMVDDIDAWENHLIAQNVKYRPRATRPDGAFQIFLTDPDGHVIELCTAVVD